MDDKHHLVPPNTGKLGLALFLASLAMLFVAMMVAFGIIRTRPQAPPLGTLSVPPMLWVSTVLMLISSVTIQHALVCVRHEKQSHFRISLSVTLALTLLFIAIQTPALKHLLAEHERFKERAIFLYGMVFLMIVVHAAHVIGGLIPMLIVWVQAQRGRYDHEHHNPVVYVTMYWHFLDAVWLMMFAGFLILL